jgi:hypothetical protein
MIRHTAKRSPATHSFAAPLTASWRIASKRSARSRTAAHGVAAQHIVPHRIRFDKCFLQYVCLFDVVMLMLMFVGTTLI